MATESEMPDNVLLNKFNIFEAFKSHANSITANNSFEISYDAKFSVFKQSLVQLESI